MLRITKKLLNKRRPMLTTPDAQGYTWVTTGHWTMRSDFVAPVGLRKCDWRRDVQPDIRSIIAGVRGRNTTAVELTGLLITVGNHLVSIAMAGGTVLAIDSLYTVLLDYGIPVQAETGHDNPVYIMREEVCVGVVMPCQANIEEIRGMCKLVADATITDEEV